MCVDYRSLWKKNGGHGPMTKQVNYNLDFNDPNNSVTQLIVYNFNR